MYTNEWRTIGYILLLQMGAFLYLQAKNKYEITTSRNIFLNIPNYYILRIFSFSPLSTDRGEEGGGSFPLLCKH